MVISVADPEERQQPGDAEHPDAEPGALALLRHLGLGQAELGADQVGELLAQVVDEGAEVGSSVRAGTGPGPLTWVSTGSEKVISPS